MQSESKNGYELKLDECFWCEHLIGKMNCNPISPALGCFDRHFWAWRTRDFANATLQYAALPIAKVLLSAPDWLDARTIGYYKWICESATRFLVSIQRKDGSFDQLYPYELHPGVVFDLLPLLVTMRSEPFFDDDVEFRSRLDDVIERALDFALKRDEKYALIVNHLMQFAYSLYKTAITLNHDGARRRADEYVERGLEGQSRDGWFMEYDGPDMGYETRTLAYLAKIEREDLSSFSLSDAAARSIEFLTYFAYPDGSYGGSMGSRNANLFYTFGFAWYARKFGTAAAMLKFRLEGNKGGLGVDLRHYDFENCLLVFEDQLDARQLLQEGALVQTSELLPFQCGGLRRSFDDSKVCVYGTNDLYMVSHSGKGGLHGIYNSKAGKALHLDGGILFKNGDCDYSNHTTQSPEFFEFENNIQKTSTRFFQCQFETLSPFKLIVLRALNLTLWRWKSVGDFAKQLIVNRLFMKRSSADVRLQKTIKMGGEIEIEYELTWDDNSTRSFRFYETMMPMIMASSGYFEKSDSHRSRSVYELEGKAPLRRRVVITPEKVTIESH